AFASVVVMRPCSNSDFARFASISFSCAALPPRRAPLVGFGIVFLLGVCPGRIRYRGQYPSRRSPVGDPGTGPRGDRARKRCGEPCDQARRARTPGTDREARASVLLGLHEPGVRVVVRPEGVRGGG